MKKFWDWITNEAGERTLRLEGPIDEDSVWGDEITPADFRAELESDDGDITVWINSPGGNCFAAAEIYTMLKDYAGKVTVKVDALAASAASVVAMAGDKVLMSPVAMLMIHDPSTVAVGNEKDMEHAISVLSEVKESIINAYAAKTGLTHETIASLMTNESWLNAKKAVELGFADEILFEAEEDEPEEEPGEETLDSVPDSRARLFSGRQMDLAILNRLGVNPFMDEVGDKGPPTPVIGMDGKTEDGSIPYLILEKQLECLK